MEALRRPCTWSKKSLDEGRFEVFCCLGKDGGKSIQEEQNVQCTGVGA